MWNPVTSIILTGTLLQMMLKYKCCSTQNKALSTSYAWYVHFKTSNGSKVWLKHLQNSISLFQCEEYATYPKSYCCTIIQTPKGPTALYASVWIIHAHFLSLFYVVYNCMKFYCPFMFNHVFFFMGCSSNQDPMNKRRQDETVNQNLLRTDS